MKNYEELFNDNELKIWADVTTYCNAKCPQCPRTDPNGLGKAEWLELNQWSLQQFQENFPISILENCQQFEFCGEWGDAIMNKDIFEMCKYVIDNSNSTIAIHTNGSIRTPKWWKELGEMCGDRLVVTFDIDGFTQQQHEHYRVGTDLKLICDNLKALNDTESEVEVFTIIFKHNEDDIPKIAKFVKELGVEKIMFIHSTRFGKVAEINSRKIFEYTDNNNKINILEQSRFNADAGSIFLKDIILNNESINILEDYVKNN